MRRRIAALALLASLSPAAALAFGLQMPVGGELTAETAAPRDSYGIPVGAWQDGVIPQERAEGALEQAAWRLNSPGLTTAQIAAPLRRQLEEQGFSILFECRDRACGGFDFRYGTRLLPEPEMHVDLGDYRYLAAARSGPAGRELVGLVVSRSPGAGHVQVTRIAPAAADPASVVTSTKSVGLSPAREAPLSDPGIGDGLKRLGRVPLDDLRFGTGDAGLGAGPFGSLAALADYLDGDPDRRLTLVGHTDAEGGLQANLALSRQRAEAVRDRLIHDYGVDAGRVAAQGVGYLAPRAPNDTEAGRLANRRVEAVVPAE